MAQGSKKLKSKGMGLKKEKNRNKKQSLKKGARVIAPKKKNILQQAKLKKGLDKAIKANIEQEITAKVKSIEAKPFTVISAPSTSDPAKSKQSASNVKMKKK